MNIVSYEYLFFLIIVFIPYYFINDNWKRYLLCVSSIAFYAIGQPSYVILLLISVLINYFVGLSFSLENAPKRLIFYSSLVFNVGMLLYFKYLGYWLSLINPSLHIFQPQAITNLSNIILPIGISFYTFNAVGYTIDVYLKIAKPEKNAINYFIYQAFFPHVLSGPVARSKLLIPQIKQTHELNYNLVVSGFRLILLGYFKKLVIANGLSPYVNAVYSNYDLHNGTTLLFASFIFFCQLYADFSGYTDIALGTARLFGFDLINNFNKPFLSKSVTDFWRRWHISLSSWVRDYMYFPILYNLRRYKHLSIMVSTLVTFFIIGMWHGPKLNYAIFGLSQFVLIMIELYISKLIILKNHTLVRLITALQIVFTTLLFSLSFIVLKAETTKQAFEIYTKIFTNSGKIFIPQENEFLYGSLGFFLLYLGDIFSRKNDVVVFVSQQKKVIRWIVYILLISMILVCGDFNDNSFIYYQF